jgi:hypothetical protein
MANLRLPQPGWCNHQVCWNRHRKSQFNTDKATHVTSEPGYYQERMKRNVALQWLAYIVAQLRLSHKQDNSFQSKLYSTYSFRTEYLYWFYEAGTKSTKLFGTNRRTTRFANYWMGHWKNTLPNTSSASLCFAAHGFCLALFSATSSCPRRLDFQLDHSGSSLDLSFVLESWLTYLLHGQSV